MGLESGPGVLAAVLAGLGFNFFFLPPLYTFTIEDPRNVVAFFVFLVCGLLIGRLSATARVRLRQVEAERRDLAALTDLSQGFLADTNRESLLGLAVDRLRQRFSAGGLDLLAQDPGELSETAATPGTAARRNLIDLATARATPRRTLRSWEARTSTFRYRSGSREPVFSWLVDFAPPNGWRRDARSCWVSPWNGKGSCGWRARRKARR